MLFDICGNGNRELNGERPFFVNRISSLCRSGARLPLIVHMRVLDLSIYRGGHPTTYLGCFDSWTWTSHQIVHHSPHLLSPSGETLMRRDAMWVFFSRHGVAGACAPQGRMERCAMVRSTILPLFFNCYR